MNIRNVLRAYSLLHQLTDDESALLETLRGLSENERDLLVESLQPEKVVKKAAKKEASKSQRASGMAAAIKKSLESQKRVTDNGKCTFVFTDNQVCLAREDDPIHDQSFGYAGYHPFVAPSSARTAQPPSSANNGERSTTANTVDETASASGTARTGD
jgi:hypothetical protein